MISQVLEEITCILAINVYLAEEREVASDASYVLLDLSVSLGLLSEELVAGEGEDLEASFVVVGVEIDQLCEVSVGHSSLARDVDDEEDLTSVLLEADPVPIDVGYRDLVYRPVRGLAALSVVSTHVPSPFINIEQNLFN